MTKNEQTTMTNDQRSMINNKEAQKALFITHYSLFIERPQPRRTEPQRPRSQGHPSRQDACGADLLITHYSLLIEQPPRRAVPQASRLPCRQDVGGPRGPDARPPVPCPLSPVTSRPRRAVPQASRLPCRQDVGGPRGLDARPPVTCNLSPVTSRPQPRRGMILLLVIALLVLLALMGTVFILMASTDRKSAYASNSSASLNMAQQGVLNTVRGLMLSQTVDQNGQTLAVGKLTGTAFTPDTQIARFWDYPEVGGMPTPGASAQFYHSATAGTIAAPTQYAPSEPWLVSNQPYEPGNRYIPGEEVYYGDPLTGVTGRAVYVGTINKVGVGYPNTDATDWNTNVAAPTTGYAVASGQANNGVPVISALSPYLYDPVTSGYDIPWGFAGSTPLPAAGTTIPGPSGSTYTVQSPVLVPNAAVVEPHWAYNTAYNPSLAEAAGNMPVAAFGDLDAMWNMLPYSDPNGTRYRFAVRILDTSSLLNLNTGWIANAFTSTGSNTAEASDPYGIYGAFVGSVPIMNVAGLNIDPTDLTNATTNGTYVQTGGGPTGTTPGRIGNYPNTTAFYSLPVWQDALSEYELQFPSSGPTAYTYPTTPPAAYTTSLFGTNSAMDLLTGAGAGGEAFGAPFYSRVATLMPNTLGLEANSFGSGYRGLYTTYSFGRDVAAINPGTSTTGTAPPKVNLNASVASAVSLMSLADNLYTSMVASGYDPVHARAFLANYFTYRFDTTGYAGSPATLGAANLLTVPMGGSTISTTLPTTVVPAGVACTGTTAQPFLNEAEFKLTVNNGNTVVSDWAIELANPFPGTNTLPCTNYSIEVYFGGSKTSAFTVPLTGASLAGFSGTAGNKFIGVVALSGGVLYAQAKGDNDGFLIASGNAFQAGTATIDLVRNSLLGGTPTAVVDTMTVTIPTITAAQSPMYFDVSRENIGGSDGIWGCDSSGLMSNSGIAPTPTGSIGTINPTATTGGEPGVVLYDRWYSGDLVAPGATYGNNLANINDFNCIARECTTATEPLSEQIGTNIASAPPPSALLPPANLGMYYVAQASAVGDPIIPVPAGGTISPEVSESALYFDFAYDPRAAFTAADAGFLDPEIAPADTGAIPPTILSTTTLTDRSQSNPIAQIALPEGATDLVRQAGKININTAGIDVLYSAFSEDGALWKGSVAPLPLDVDQLVVDAIGFRERATAGSAIAGLPPALIVPTPGYYTKGYAGFGGVGFQSPADLLVAFIPTIESGKFPTALITTPTTLQQRDAAWADVENFISVRSDTFAVYGLVQALRLNPAYSAAVAAGNASYNPTDWYNASQGYLIGTGTVYHPKTISTDPTNQNAEFIMEGSRRFIAIVDRSYCNNGATVQPHIVALKILPQ